jgi:peptidoglycan/xylan/chitin deacetylase (PgdA/CDA1 family)
MRKALALGAAVLCLLSAAGCASRPKDAVEGAAATPLAFAGSSADPVSLRLAGPYLGDRKTSLTGRTILVKSIGDIALKKGEVVLTFDDGPAPKYTNAVLDALDGQGVKATFLMVGQMARAHPAMVRKVAARGHTVGTHTQNHANLAHASADTASREIRQGQESVAAALVPMRAQPAPFFRFPYLSDTKALRQNLASDGIVVIDADVDSKDYFVSSPDDVKSRTLARLDQRGSGIILFHDIHARTAAMLPGFLAELRTRGYTVVNLVPATSQRSLQHLLTGAGS